ncbi:MAG: aminopeptidase N [Alphaproteobacteria bacterium]|nr:aminopeptidase N [Alphaproteobacteria bacterium]
MPSIKETRLADYTVPDFLFRHVDLDVDIQADHAKISSRIEMTRNPKSKNKKAPLFLNGEEQKLISVTVNGRALKKTDYKLTPHGLTLGKMPDKAVVEIVSTHNPYANTTLAGFYASGSMLSTQCEAEGFRRITYYPDRPDVMAKFRVTLHADKKKYPVLLANGNLIRHGSEGKTRHFALWEDPFPKPCYLFAMVAGKLDKVTSSFKTRSGRKVLIEIYVEPGKTDETHFALAALKKSMKWDEQRFGLEYDLDRFMMVATPFFNMGAMENKGLNIFNDSCVLGRTDTATDGTISFIERVVAHEYFHNWTGDRITCRDWFQLSLKEGLTVFREQEFCGDVNSIAVERLENVRDVRRRQFAEDAGALAHPVRPDHYQAIDNFYTATVYDKGAEVVRMIQTLVGRKGFDKGMALYVKRHDGQAVTCDDFVKAMSDANKIDLKQFMLWYKQAGTPVLDVTSAYDAKAKKLTLTVAQSCKPTPGQPKKLPYHIPFAIGMLDSEGKDMLGAVAAAGTLRGGRAAQALHVTVDTTRVLSLKKAKEVFVFNNVAEKPVLSLLRDFSAPVRLNYAYTDEELLFLLAHDSDPFTRWEAGFKLATQYLLNAPTPAQEQAFIAALGEVLRDKKLDPAFKAMVLSLPGEGELGLALQAQGKLIEPDILFAARKAMIKRIAAILATSFTTVHQDMARSVKDTSCDGASMGRRGLKNLSLSYLASSGDAEILQQAYKQATTSANMTEQIAALGVLSETTSPLRDKAFAAFEKKWKKVPTIMDKWFAVQASARRPDALKTVQKLANHPAFTFKNPNRVSALIGVFAGNILGFHAKDGSGYKFIADMILKIDPLNPHSAAGLAKSFVRWRDYDTKRQKLMQAQLKRLASAKKLSPNTAEIVQKSLKG